MTQHRLGWINHINLNTTNIQKHTAFLSDCCLATMASSEIQNRHTSVNWSWERKNSLEYREIHQICMQEDWLPICSSPKFPPSQTQLWRTSIHNYWDANNAISPALVNLLSVSTKCLVISRVLPHNCEPGISPASSNIILTLLRALLCEFTILTHARWTFHTVKVF